MGWRDFRTRRCSPDDGAVGGFRRNGALRRPALSNLRRHDADQRSRAGLHRSPRRRHRACRSNPMSGRCRKAASIPARIPGQPPSASSTRRPASARSRNSARSPDWLIYDIPRTVAGRAWKGRYRGQRQKWFAVRFTGEDSRDQCRQPRRRPQGGIRQLALGADEESSRT